METPYDWITIGIFAGLIVLFMQRSVSDPPEGADALWLYLVAGIGCAVSNYFGNEGLHLVAVSAILATLAFIHLYLKPLDAWPKS